MATVRSAARSTRPIGTCRSQTCNCLPMNCGVLSWRQPRQTPNGVRWRRRSYWLRLRRRSVAASDMRSVVSPACLYPSFAILGRTIEYAEMLEHHRVVGSRWVVECYRALSWQDSHASLGRQFDGRQWVFSEVLIGDDFELQRREFVVRVEGGSLRSADLCGSAARRGRGLGAGDDQAQQRGQEHSHVRHAVPAWSDSYGSQVENRLRFT